jgi:predicted permease
MSWGRFFRRAHTDRQSVEELRSYVELETDENIARGMSPEVARRAAHIKLGNPVRIREEIYRFNTVGILDSLSRNLRYAFRGMRRQPTFTLAVVLTLALSLGASTAIFAVVNGVLLKPLPYPQAEQLVSLKHTAPGVNIENLPLSPTQLFTYRDEGRVFQQIGLYADGGTTITGIGEPEQARALFVSDGTLQALGIQPALGRLFTSAETTATATGNVGGGAIILTYGYWQRRFGGDPSVIGKPLQVDSPVQALSQRTVVVGVMPRSFRFLDMRPQAEVILPIVLNRSGLTLDGFGFRALARLKPGATVAEADADIVRMLPIWQHAWPAGRTVRVDAGWRIAPALRPLKDEVVGTAGETLWILMAMIGIVLLIACANVANLMLVRSDSRRHELAVRAALGAGRGRIARELLTEGAVLALAGGALGVALAQGGVKVLTATAPASLPRLGEISLDPLVIAFAVVVSLASSLLFGAASAFKHVAPRDTSAGITARGASASRERQRTRNSLVVVQVALAVVLLVSAGLMIRTFRALQRVDPGFTDVATLQTARLWFPAQRFRDPEQVTRMQQEIVAKIAALPGVRAAGFASAVPMEAGRASQTPLAIDGRTYTSGMGPLRNQQSVAPGYFNALGTRIVAGRDIKWADIYFQAKVCIVSENLAREVWGSAAAALGKRVHEPTGSAATAVWREIVGVVQDVHEIGLYQPAPTMVYWPIFMDSFGGRGPQPTRPINVVVRSDAAGSEALLSAMRNAVWSVNPDLPVFLTRTMKDLYDDSIARTSFALVMLAIASTMALGLGIIGVYGVLSYIVSQRTREIGIRLALGAEPQRLLRMFVRQGMVLTGIGAAVGLLAAVAVSQWMSSLLFGVERLDPPTYAAVLGVLCLAAALASYIPARRAAAVDPVKTLTAE